ncbi:filamentous hemagglutinin N-terminal domain-containing protein [Pseudomonas soli]|uniref:Filamentous hemagglutinin N-terminal domain-containing protein n=1 Tax=Pseudomonas soli TaxID=1306993 RepID=A0ABU7GPB5_9PSED|nr:filamentous hemagglutinin N-terminal domain-containing protein [Pseudomonas soli]MEE1880863.1 filamentous hemagglutinin N-terminal domain-containing protein [Pseudomonas soli]
MDVRLFAFLARQRSAVVQPREHFCGLPKRGLAFLLANAMFWQPLWAQAAEGVVVSGPGTSLGQAGNGVPIVNIAAPNGSGLSHNQFSDYNVGQQGLILNNATDRTQATQLGGIILGNPNLQGTAANVILNEVNGANASQLRGYTEVAGHAAKVIVANPHGITCDGCGFINTPQVTLSTGKPLLDGRGAVSGYQVDGGSVALEGAGLNADNVERFDIITRSARLNAQLRARELNVITGRNDVDAQTLAATPRAGNAADAPALAIDSSALGGMYAGAIRLVGTEAGVGVRLAGDVAASGGDIRLDANGQLTMAQASASGAVKLQAAGMDLQGPVHGAAEVEVRSSADLTSRQAITAGNRISLQAAGTLANLGVIEAGVNADGSRNAVGDVSVASGQLLNNGKSIVASRDLAVQVQGRLDNRSGTLSAGQDSHIAAANLDNSAQGRALAGRNQVVQASQSLGNQGGLVSAGQTQSVTTQTLDNRNGELSAQAHNTLRANQLDNQNGKLSAGQALDIAVTGQLDNRGGTLAAGQDLQLQAASVDNRNAGRIASDGQATARLGQLDQRGAGQLHGAQALTLDMADGHLDNSEGGLLTTPGQLTLQRLGTVNNQRGEISAGQAYALVARQLDNSSGKLLGGNDLQVRIAGQLANTAGLIAGHDLTLNAATLLSQDGTLQARGGLQLQVAGQLDNSRGRVLAERNLVLQAGSLVNLQGQVAGNGSLLLTSNGLDNRQGRISAAQGLTLDLSRGHWNNEGGTLQSPGALLLRNLATVGNGHGEISSQQAFVLEADSFDNQDGKLLAEQGLTLRIAQLLDNARGLVSAEGLNLRAGSLLNTDGKLKAREATQLHLDGALDNQRGEISAADLQLSAASVDNRAGRLQGDRQLTIASTGAVDNRDGTVVAAERLQLGSAALTNDRGQISSQGQAQVSSAGLVNAGGQIYAAQGLELNAGQVDNTDAGRIHAGQSLVARINGLRQANGGQLSSGADLRLDLNHGLLDNQGGLINAPGVLLLQQLARVDNRGGEISSDQAYTLTAVALDNQGGKLLSQQSLTLRIAQALDNAKGRISGQTLDFQAASLGNHAGVIEARQGLALLLGGDLDNRLGRLAAQGDISLQARDLDNRAGVVSGGQAVGFSGQRLDNSGKGLVTGKGPLLLTADTLVNRQDGKFTSGAALALKAGQLDNSERGHIGAHGAVLAEVGRLDQHGGGKLASDADLTLDLAGGHLDNQGGLIRAPGQLLLKRLGSVDNRGGEISSSRAFELNAASLDNGDGSLLSDQALAVRIAQVLRNVNGLVSGSRLDASAASLDNHDGTLSGEHGLTVQVSGALANVGGELSSGAVARIEAGSLDNRDGGIIGDQAALLTVQGALDNRNGTLLSQKDLQVSAASLDNREGGNLASDGRIQAHIGGLLDNQGGEVRALGLIELVLGRLDNRAGLISGKDLLTLRSASADNQQGVIHADRQLQLFVDALDNRKGVLRSNGVLAFKGPRLDNREGLLSATAALDLEADEVDNGKGRIASRGNLDARVGTLRQQGGELVAEGSLTLRGAALDNRAGGIVVGNAGVDLQVTDIDNKGGRLASQTQVLVQAEQLDNSDAGRLIADNRLALTVARLVNQNKGLVSGRDVELRGARLDNQGGSLGAGHSLLVVLQDRGQPLRDAVVDNHNGLIDSAGSLTFEGVTLLNQAGKVTSKGDLSVTSATALDNQGGTLETDGHLQLAAASLDNRNKGRITAEGNSTVRTGILENGQGGLLSSGQRLDLGATSVGNQAGGSIAGRQVLASVTGLDQQGGELFSLESLSLDLNHGKLDNSDGLIRGPGQLLLNNLGEVLNRGGQITSNQNYELVADSLDNSAGKLLGSQGLTLRIAQQLDNVAGMVSARQLVLRANALNNAKGTLNSLGDIDLKVLGQLDNQAGVVSAEGLLLLEAATVLNGKGQLSARADLRARLGELHNQAGEVEASGVLDLTADQLDNRAKGLLAATGLLDVKAATLDNRNGEISGQGAVHLAGLTLDNGDGGLVKAKGALTVEHQAVLNRLGLIAADGALTLRGKRLDNTQGEVRGEADVSALFSAELINDKGSLASEGALSLDAASISNAAGLVSSAGDLVAASKGALSNQGGKLLGDGKITLTGTQLDNSEAGLVSAKGDLLVSATSLDNKAGARLTSGSLLRIDTGLLDNSGGRITAAKTLVANVDGLRQHGGTLFAEGSVELDLNHGQLDNQGGLINTPGQLLLKRLAAVDNRGGEISSANAFTLAATALENSNGKLLGQQGLTLVVERALTSLKGQIAAASLSVKAQRLDNSGGAVTSRGDLTLDIAGQLVNREGGQVSASRQLNVTSNGLDNQGGKMLAATHLALTSAAAVDNGDNGLINSLDSLTLGATALRNAGGEISAKGAVQVTAYSLSQQGGRLVGESSLALLLGIAGGDVDNRAGLIHTKGQLTLSNLRDLDNRQGEISSPLGFNLAARAVDNSGGRLISSQQLSLGAASLINQGGLISGWQGLSVNAASLDNRNNGTLSSRDGDLAVTLAGALDNRNAGALVSLGQLRIKAAGLDNRGGYLASTGAQQLDLRGGSLDNSQGGRVDAGGAFSLQANGLNNRSGTLVGLDTLTLDLASQLDNAQGTLLASSGLQIRGNAAIANQGGSLISRTYLDLNGASLDNSDKGTLAANAALSLNVGGELHNDRDGLLHSQAGAITLKAASLGNQAGIVQAKGAIDLSSGGAVDNQGGKLIAQDGNLLLKAASVDNRGGIIASLQGVLDAQVGGLLRNGQGGTLQARQLKLIALGGLDNSGGRLAAQAGALEIRTGNLNNRGGGLYGLGQVSIDANDLDNGAGGQLAGQALDFTLRGAFTNVGGIVESDTRIGLSAASLNNQGGQLRSLGSAGNTTLQLGSVLDNRNGVLEVASQDFTLQAASFLNAGGRLLHGGVGELQIGMANLGNAGGDIVTLGGLTLNAASWTNSSAVQAARLTVNVGELNLTGGGQLLASTSLVGRGGNWTNNGLIASNGTLDLALTGQYAGSGQATSLGNLGLSAAGVQVLGGGRIAGASDVRVSSGGAFINQGRITSGRDMTLNAGSFGNSGTVGSAGKLDLVSQVLRNEGSAAGQSLISSGGDMRLLTNSFTNRFATVYSLGGLMVAANAAQGRASLIENVSATLQSDGAMGLHANTFSNRRDNFAVNERLISGTIKYQCLNCKGRHYDLNYYVTEEIERITTGDSPAASINTGGALSVQAGAFENKHSSISAATSINIAADTFNNEGASTESLIRTRIFRNPEDSERSGVWRGLVGTGGAVAEYAKYNSKTKFEYIYKRRGREDVAKETLGMGVQDTGQANPYYRPNSGYALPAQLLAYTEISKTETQTNTGVAAGAVIQAGGLVSITATKTLNNGVTRSNTGYSSLALNGADTQAASQVRNNVVKINAQLPPDLAQRQVNPLTLPGFTLPTGGTGLFRLSAEAASQAGASTAAPAPSNWTLGGASIDLAQRQQPLPVVQGRTVDIAAITAIQGTERQLAANQRQGLGLDTRADVASVAAAGQAQGPDNQPGRTQVSAGTQLQPTQVSGPGLGALEITRPGAGNAAVPLERDTARPIIQPGTAPVLQDVRMAAAQAVSSATTAVIPQTIARVQGLPANSRAPQPHKYLVETDPVLTDLKQFMSSDYLLGNLGYDPDQSWKRLGDGYFEQQLIQQAVTARTGKRFIDGQTSDEALYRHLMDNAVASRDQLGLSVGVTLTSAQVAALTKDIVWLEKHEVNGEQVLVPVLYLAHANDRLAPTGALIEGKDINLIAGESLRNSGTLRASNNLSASAGKDLVNAGLIQAGGRIDLLAGDTLFNGAGGIISGRDVTLNTLLGDLINERTQTMLGGMFVTEGRLDNAARIEAGNDLTLGIGRDFLNVGGMLQAGRDVDVRTGRDLLIGSAEQTYSYQSGHNNRSSSVQQFGSQISAGRDIDMKAGHDFAAIGSELDAKRNIAISAVNDMTLSSAANEEHFYSKTKKVTRQEDHVRQVGTRVNAAGDISLTAGEDLKLISSRVSAGDEAYLYAGDQLELLAETDSDYSLYDKKSKGSWGKKKTRRDEVTDVRHIGSEISTGGDLILESGGDQRYQVAKLTSGDDLTLDSGGDITFEGVKDLHQESHEKSKSNAGWFSMKGKGRTDETLRQSELAATGDVVINAVGNIRADVRQVNQQTVRESIDAMVKADPKLAWLKDLEAQGGVDWRQVQEVHTSFKYNNSGLGPAAQMVIAILMTVMLGPAGAGLSGMQLAGAASLATTGAVATINNKGDLGAGLKAIVSKEGLTNAAIATITAGVAEHYLGDMTMTKQVNGKTVVDLGSMEAIGHFAGQQLINNTSAAVIAKAFGRDVTLAGILQSTIYNSLAAVSFDQVGNLNLKTGSPEKIALHALVGGFIAEASGSDFAVGAMAAGVNEAFANQLRRMATAINPQQRDHLMLMSSQLLGVVAAAAVDGGNAGSLQAGSWVAGNATQYNNLSHNDMPDFVDDMNICGLDEGCQRKLWVANEHKLKSEENFEWAKETGGVVRARDLMGQIASGLADLEKLNCLTPTCTEFKELLTERAVLSLEKLADVSGQWAPMLNMIAMLPIGQRINGLRPPGVSGGVLDSPRVQAAIERMAQSRPGVIDPRNPLSKDAITRNGERLVVNQGQNPTCGHNSCGMVLDTLGKKVDIDSLIQKLKPQKDGIYPHDVASLLRGEGVPAQAFGSRNVADLERYTNSGTPVIARIFDNTNGTRFSHFVVVDGVTTRNGVAVVAIRDPHGVQYFSPVRTFEKNFSGEVVVPRSALKK